MVQEYYYGRWLRRLARPAGGVTRFNRLYFRVEPYFVFRKNVLRMDTRKAIRACPAALPSCGVRANCDIPDMVSCRRPPAIVKGGAAPLYRRKGRSSPPLLIYFSLKKGLHTS